jgi:hypothetical protein
MLSAVSGKLAVLMLHLAALRAVPGAILRTYAQPCTITPRRGYTAAP